MSDETMDPAQNEVTETPAMPAPAPVVPVVPDAPMSSADMREAALQRGKKLKTKLLDVPEWGSVDEDGTVHPMRLMIRELKGRQRNAFLTSITTRDGSRDMDAFYSNLVILSSYNPLDMSQVFDLADRDELLETGGVALERVAQVAAKLSALDGEGLTDTKKN